MEKISIARRRLEKKKAAVYVKNKPNDSPSDISYPPPGASYSPSEGSCPLPGTSYSPPEGSYTPPGASYSLPEGSSSPLRESSSPSGVSCPPQEMNNCSQEVDTTATQTPPVYSLDSLISLINEEGGLLELGKKQFTLEIVSGVEKPIKMLVSIQPVKANSNSPGKNYEEGYLTPEEAAQILKVSKNTIYRQLKEGSLKGLKIGCRWRVLLSPHGKTEGSERGNS